MEFHMKFVTSLTLLILLFTVLAQDDILAQNSPRLGSLGFGLEAGLVHYNGDVQDGGTFPDAKSSLQPGAAFSVRYGFNTKEKSWLGIALNSRLGYYPMKAESEYYSFDSRTLGSTVALEWLFWPWSPASPYIMTGIGLLFMDRTINYSDRNNDIGNHLGSNTSAICFPIGAGLYFDVNRRVSLFVQYSSYLTLSDDLDGWRARENDNFNTFTIGIMYYPILRSAKNLKRAALDSDGDGLSDVDEQQRYNTNPDKSDTDGDGLTDRDEIMILRTNPNNADSDGDGTNDGDEIKQQRDPSNKDK